MTQTQPTWHKQSGELLAHNGEKLTHFSRGQVLVSATLTGVISGPHLFHCLLCWHLRKQKWLSASMAQSPALHIPSRIWVPFPSRWTNTSGRFPLAWLGPSHWLWMVLMYGKDSQAPADQNKPEQKHFIIGCRVKLNFQTGPFSKKSDSSQHSEKSPLF